WVYMTHIMNQTQTIALASGSIILPLRHPVHTAKSIASLQALSGGRMIMGIASGDRPIEYPAFAQDIHNRTELFQDSFHYLKALSGDFPNYQSKHFGQVYGNIDLLPKHEHQTSYLVTGHSGQSLEWIAEHADGWLYYPRDFKTLPMVMERWKRALSETEQPWKPFAQSLYVDLLKDSTAKPEPIHLGFKAGMDYTLAHLKLLESYGVNHVILNLKFSSRSVETVMEEFGEWVLPHFQ
ncbi:MAG: LLM class flavin-dependent oxidoreductase, partial [Bacteroidota bacterium]